MDGRGEGSWPFLLVFLRAIEVQAADFRFPVARGEADLQSLTSTFARFVGALEEEPP